MGGLERRRRHLEQRRGREHLGRDERDAQSQPHERERIGSSVPRGAHERPRRNGQPGGHADRGTATLRSLPAVAEQPVDRSVTAPAEASFKVKEGSVPANCSAAAIQWEVSSDGGATWSNAAGANISGATSATLKVNPTSASESGRQFRAVLTNAHGETDSQAATLTVAPPPCEASPAVAEQPVDRSVTAPAEASFKVKEGSVPANCSAAAIQWEVSSDGGATWSNAAGANISGATSATLKVNPTSASESGRQFRAVLTNAHGETVSQAATLTVGGTSVPVNVSPPTISGLPERGKTLLESHGSWTDEPTFYEYEWLRCEGNACQPIAGATHQTYQLTQEDCGKTIEVSETALNGAGPSAPATSAATALVKCPVLHANAGEDQVVIQGAPVTLDGSSSTPSSAIESYEWDFGDGSTGSGAIVEHVYAHAGTYEATLTVSDGFTTSSDKATVQVEEPISHGIEVTTLDCAGGQPLAGTEVLYISPDGTRTAAISGASGKAALRGLPNGKDTFYAYKEGYKPAVGQITVTAGVGKATVQLCSGALALTKLEVHEMTLGEIEAAGIDTSDPANREVHEFKVVLAFGEGAVQLPYHCYLNSLGRLVGNCTSLSLSGYQIVAVGGIVDGHPMVQYLVMEGSVSTLKQFVSVTMAVQNLSGEPFTLAHNSARLDVPAGLSLAPTSKPQTLTKALPDIPGEGSASTSWVIRGDEPGFYTLSAAYHGSLEPFEAPVDLVATLSEPLHIWGADALTLSATVDRGELREGVPYHVKLSVTNVSTVPVYDVDVTLNPNVHVNFIYQPRERFHDGFSVIPPGGTVSTRTYILVPAINAGAFNQALSSVGFAGQSHTGQNIHPVQAPPLYDIEAVPVSSGVHLHWQPVPGAEGYEVFSTPDLFTPFGEAPDPAATSLGGSPMARLSASATDAYLSGHEGRNYYAVTALIKGTETLESTVIPAKGGSTPPVATCDAYWTRPSEKLVVPKGEIKGILANDQGEGLTAHVVYISFGENTHEYSVGPKTGALTFVPGRSTKPRVGYIKYYDTDSAGRQSNTTTIAIKIQQEKPEQSFFDSCGSKPVAVCDVYWAQPGKHLHAPEGEADEGEFVPNTRGMLSNDVDSGGSKLKVHLPVDQISFAEADFPYKVTESGELDFEPGPSPAKKVAVIKYHDVNAAGAVSKKTTVRIIIQPKEPPQSAFETC